MDAYATLGLTPSADPNQIKQAYRRLVRRYHPDVNPSPDAQRRFQAIQLAYETLTNPRASSAQHQTVSTVSDSSGTLTGSALAMHIIIQQLTAYCRQRGLGLSTEPVIHETQVELRYTLTGPDAVIAAAQLWLSQLLAARQAQAASLSAAWQKLQAANAADRNAAAAWQPAVERSRAAEQQLQHILRLLRVLAVIVGLLIGVTMILAGVVWPIATIVTVVILTVIALFDQVVIISWNQQAMRIARPQSDGQKRHG
jgi:hypothetical protein